MKTPTLAKRLKRALRYRALRMGVGLVSLLPLTWASRLGQALGTLAYALLGGERRKALASLAQAFPQETPDQLRRLARAAFSHLGAAALELADVRHLDPQLERWVEFPAQSRAAVLEGIARGRGVVFSTGHVGSWELLARCVGQLCCEVNAVGRETSDPRLTAWVEELRASANVRTVWRGQAGSARELLKVLRRGGLLALLIDQDTRVQSVFAPFFGRPASTPRAAAELALRTGAALVSGFCQRVGPGPRYRIVVKEIAFAPSGERETDVVALTALLTRDIEEAIRRHPEQWVWMHQRWKTQPSSAANTSAAEAAPSGLPA